MELLMGENHMYPVKCVSGLQSEGFYKFLSQGNSDVS